MECDDALSLNYGVRFRYVVHLHCTFTPYIYTVHLHCTFTLYFQLSPLEVILRILYVCVHSVIVCSVVIEFLCFSAVVFEDQSLLHGI